MGTTRARGLIFATTDGIVVNHNRNSDAESEAGCDDEITRTVN